MPQTCRNLLTAELMNGSEYISVVLNELFHPSTSFFSHFIILHIVSGMKNIVHPFCLGVEDAMVTIFILRYGMKGRQFGIQII